MIKIRFSLNFITLKFDDTLSIGWNTSHYNQGHWVNNNRNEDQIQHTNIPKNRGKKEITVIDRNPTRTCSNDEWEKGNIVLGDIVGLWFWHSNGGALKLNCIDA